MSKSIDNVLTAVHGRPSILAAAVSAALAALGLLAGPAAAQIDAGNRPTLLPAVQLPAVQFGQLPAVQYGQLPAVQFGLLPAVPYGPISGYQTGGREYPTLHVRLGDGSVLVLLGDGSVRHLAGDGSVRVFVPGDGSVRVRLGDGSLLVLLGDGSVRVILGDGSVRVLRSTDPP